MSKNKKLFTDKIQKQILNEINSMSNTNFKPMTINTLPIEIIKKKKKRRYIKPLVKYCKRCKVRRVKNHHYECQQCHDEKNIDNRNIVF